MREKLTEAVEDYLKTIYDLTLHRDVATTSEIAERLGVTPASVTGMIQKLASSQPPLVGYRKHKGVDLTAEGEKIALEIIRHHRLLELFLHETLGYTWDEVDAEADRLEHVISEVMEEKIADALGDPILDPHGDPIPRRDLSIPPPCTLRMRDLKTGQTGVVRRVRDTNPELLRYLSKIHLVPGAAFRVLDISPLDENLSLRIHGQKGTIVLGPLIAKQIYVELTLDSGEGAISES